MFTFLFLLQRQSHRDKLHVLVQLLRHLQQPETGPGQSQGSGTLFRSEGARSGAGQTGVLGGCPNQARGPRSACKVGSRVDVEGVFKAGQARLQHPPALATSSWVRSGGSLGHSICWHALGPGLGLGPAGVCRGHPNQKVSPTATCGAGIEDRLGCSSHCAHKSQDWGPTQQELS